jgi:uncharacterized protein with NRDE domain
VCTLTVAWQAFPEAPVLVAANRDERYSRPSVEPGLIESEHRIVAPTDEEAGGTWIGYNDAGLVAALTNRWAPTPGKDRSRGLLVREALDREGAEAAARYVERDLDERAYEGFYLLLADRTAAILIEYDGGPRLHRLDPGVHVVMNTGFDDAYFLPEGREEPARRQAESGRLLGEHLRPEPGETADDWLDRAAGALGDHEFGVCIHGDGFGTRSSSLLRIDADGHGRYRFAAGPPCETPYEAVEERA